MAGLRIGRQPLEILTNVESVRHQDAETVEFTGRFEAPTMADAKLMRAHFLALTSQERDEDHVPLVWDVDANYDGFVEVLAASVEIEPGMLSAEIGGQFRWNLTVRYLPGGPRAWAESILLSHTRPNQHGILPSAPGVNASTFWHFVPPAAAAHYTLSTWAYQWPASGIASAAGPLRGTRQWDGTALGHHRARYKLPPAHWYQAAPTIRFAGKPVHGRTASTGPQTWELNNSILSIVPEQGVFANGAATVLRIDRWDTLTSQFLAGFSILLRINDPLLGSNVRVLHLDHVTILRNTPTVCVLRLHLVNALPADYPVPSTLDLTLRRGSRTVECLWTAWGTYPSEDLYLEVYNPDLDDVDFNVVEMSADTGKGVGLMRYSANPQGMRWSVATGQPYTLHPELWTDGCTPIKADAAQWASRNTVQRQWAFAITVNDAVEGTGLPVQPGWATGASTHLFQTVERTRIVGA